MNNLFNNSKDKIKKNKYLNSKEFSKDLRYWNDILSDSEKYVKYYNIKSNSYKTKKVTLKNNSINTFLTKNNIPKFNFITGIFSLYISRVDRTQGCLFNTINNDSCKTTLLKIVYDENISFNEHLNKIESILNETKKHSKADIENYTDIKSFYSIYDLTSSNNISITNEEKCALTLNIHDESLELIYNTDLFEEIYIDHMLMNIESVINNVLNSSNQLCKNIPIISEEDKSLIAEFCKSDRVDVDNDKTIGLAVHKNAIKNPNSIAIDDGDKQLTYLEFDKLTNSIAYDLINNYNINQGTPVCLMISRNYYFPAMVIALNKIGATAIPIDPNYPKKRIEHMINISESQNIIISKEYEDLYDFDINTIIANDLETDNDVDFDIKSFGDDLFAIMFTSGTTGIPKGVKIANKQISGISNAYRKIFDISGEEIIGCYASFSFVGSYGMYFALYLGASARIFKEDERKDSLLLIKKLKENPIDIVTLPPSVGIPIFENDDLKIRYMGLAGAKINELEYRENYTKLVNFYGSTEVILAINKIFDLKNMDNRIPLGKPLSNIWVYILDKNNEQVPIGVPGEICISSEYISPGYINNENLSDNSFIDNPHSDCESNKRIYKTGDIGFYNFDGEIEIIGREDNQLSVRGFRVETNEIMKILNDLNIKESYLDVENDTLVLYYTTKDDVNIDDIKNALKMELPEYMIPSLFIKLDKIPLNVNGKIDKFALKKINKNNINEDIDDEILKTITEGFKKVLNKEVILIDDDFVALGGNSLSSMNLQLYLKNKLNVDISSNKLIELSTPLKITDFIKFNSNEINNKVNYTFDDICPLSESQLNVYLDEITNDVGSAYNNSFKIKFNDSYSINEIENALTKLFEFHPILKARVLIENEMPSFCFDGNPQIIEGSLDDIESFVHPFEIDKHLSRFLIVKECETLILCMDCHHLIFDGTSINILLDNLFAILNDNIDDFVDNGVLRLVSFEENNIIDSNYMDDGKKFFDEMLTDREECHDLLASIDKENKNNEYNDYLTIENEYLNSFLQENSITYNQFFTTVFAYTLSRFTGSSKVLFNLVEDGRGHLDLSNSIGMYVRTLPLLIDCKNQNTNSFLRYSSKLVNSAMKYDFYPFHILANEYDLNSDIFFQFAQDIFYKTVHNKFIKSIEELKHDFQGDMAFYIFNSGNDKYGIKILYSDKFNKNMIKRFVESYKLILQEFTKVNQLSEIKYTLTSDLKLLDTINKTEHDLKYEDILDAFNDNLSKYPDNKIVSYKNRSYTYAEGAYIANKIANCLKDMDIKKQDNVAFMVERSEYYMFCPLAILSLGACYVPLDDKHPDERIKFILNDTQSTVVIVSDET